MSDTVSRFDGRADDYAKYRPTYPSQAIDELLAGLALTRESLVADIGAGTGISAALLESRGLRVTGIEPNAEMRAVALAAGLDVRDARAAHLPFADGSVDLLTAFQAYHWFADDATAIEFARVVKPGGRIAIVWNERDDDDDFTRGYGDAVDGFAKRIVLAESAASPAASVLLTDRFPPPRWRLRAALFHHTQRFDRAGIAGRARSTSYAPRDGEPFDRMRAELDALFDRYARDGTVVMHMQTEMFVLDRAAGDHAPAAQHPA